MNAFPLEIKHGSAVVTIYHRERKGYEEFRVAFYEEGKRKLRSFASFDEAKREAESKARAVASGDLAALKMTGEQAREYAEAAKHAKRIGVRVDTLAREYVALWEKMGGDYFKEAVGDFIRRRATIKSATVAEVVKLFIDQKTKRTKHGKEASLVYVKDLRSRLGAFADAFQMNLDAVKSEDVERFLENRGSERTRYNYARLLRTLLRFAQAKKYLDRDADWLEGIELDFEDTSEIEIFTPKELSALMAAARPEIVPFLALGCFAGLRHAEIKRLDWQDIDLARGIITVAKGKAKTRSRRIIPIQPNLSQWLAIHKKDSGPVVEFANCAKQLLWLARDSGIPWKHNAPRHSFISYRLAVLKDENAVALEAGNSPAMIFGSYRELVTAGDAAAWFAVSPETPANIVAMGARV